jgi:hypothetical protein
MEGTRPVRQGGTGASNYDTRVRGLAAARGDAAGRKNPHNHAQTIRNRRRSLRNADAGARLIQAEGLDSKSAADISTAFADRW